MSPPRWMCLLALLIAVTQVAALFYLGAQRFAGGLFVHPADKVVHLLFYGWLCGLFWTMLGGRRGLADWGAAMLAGGVGLADEAVQMMNPGRYASVDDLIFDGIGIAIAVAVLVNARTRIDFTSPARIA